MESPKWVNEEVVSEITGLALQTLRNRRMQGLGPAYSKVTRGVRYKVSDVVEFMESRKVIPRDERGKSM